VKAFFDALSRWQQILLIVVTIVVVGEVVSRIVAWAMARSRDAQPPASTAAEPNGGRDEHEES